MSSIHRRRRARRCCTRARTREDYWPRRCGSRPTSWCSRETRPWQRTERASECGDRLESLRAAPVGNQGRGTREGKDACEVTTRKRAHKTSTVVDHVQLALRAIRQLQPRSSRRSLRRETPRRSPAGHLQAVRSVTSVTSVVNKSFAAVRPCGPGIPWQNPSSQQYVAEDSCCGNQSRWCGAAKSEQQSMSLIRPHIAIRE